MSFRIRTTLALLSLFTAQLAAQGPGGEITGAVTDASGAVVAGATIIVKLFGDKHPTHR
jgi:hypothetical protein